MGAFHQDIQVPKLLWLLCKSASDKCQKVRSVNRSKLSMAVFGIKLLQNCYSNWFRCILFDNFLVPFGDGEEAKQ